MYFVAGAEEKRARTALQRQVAKRMYLDGYTYKDISALLGVSTVMVWKWVRDYTGKRRHGRRKR